MMILLFVASDRMEYAGILARASEVRPVALPVDWSRSAKVGGHETLLVANGVGGERAGAAVAAAVERFHAEAVVSTGFCGALDERLGVADVVVADWVVAGPHRYRAAKSTGDRTVYSADHVVQTAEEKRQLRESGACAVEMEAAGVAARAEMSRLPFYCIKSVTDLAGETMANDFNSALRADGHFDTMLILRRVLRHPTERLPELLRLRNRCTRAARALGDFLADCRF